VGDQVAAADNDVAAEAEDAQEALDANTIQNSSVFGHRGFVIIEISDMKITILYVGQKTSEYDEAIERYANRIRRPFVIDQYRIKPAGLPKAESILRECLEIREYIEKNSGSYVIILDERGKQLRSEQFSEILTKKLEEAQDIIFVIGGSYGLNEEVKKHAQMLMSLSQMTLPHEMVHLILTEQIYRAIDIHNDGNYHHD
jgi:23S rRNA (pseudouridine1915-N3)-methyltransferase